MQLGDAQTAITSVNTGGAVAAAALASKAAWAVPVIGAAVAGVTLALTLIFSRKGPRQKVATTQIVNELEPQLKANLEGYLSGPRTRSSQAAAIANFDAAWQYLTSTSACGSPEMGNPGKACISDRNRGGRWDWFAYYRDPIAHDSQVRPDPTAAESMAATAAGFFGGNWMMLAGVAAIVIGLLLTGEKNGHV